MAGMIDVHMAMVLRDRWKAVAASPTLWSNMFDKLPESVVAGWHTELVSTDLKVMTAFTPEKGGGPLIVIQMQDEPTEVQPLGYFAGFSGTGSVSPHHSMLVKETVTMTMFCGNPELLRAIYVFARAQIMLSVNFLLDAGYMTVEYLGGGDIHPERDLLPEELGMYIRTQRWSVISDTTVSGEAYTFKEPHVHVADITFDDAGNKGGTTVPQS